MSTVTVYDAVDVAAIPADASIILAYIDGDYDTYSLVKARFPNSRVLTVTTTGRDRADLGDVESGDLIPETGALVFQQGIVRGLYSDVSTEGTLSDAIGYPFTWWAADPTGTPHLVTSTSWARVVGTQWAWPGHGSGGNYDVSWALNAFVNPTPAPTPAPSVPDYLEVLV